MSASRRAPPDAPGTVRPVAAPWRRGERLIFGALVGALWLAPLPFGAVPAWASTALSGGLGMALALWGWSAARGRTRVHLEPGLAAVAAPFLATIVWAALTAMPLPETLTYLAPAPWHAATSTLGSDFRTLSLAPSETAAAILRLITFAGLFFLAFELGDSEERRAVALEAIALAGTFYAGWGLIEYLGENRVLGLVRNAYPDSLASTFVNRNGFASYCGLALVAAAGAACGRRSAGDPAAWVFAGCGVVLAAALGLTQSRGGLAAAAIGLAAFALISTRRSILLRLLAALGLALGVMAVALIQSGSFTAIRMEAAPEAALARVDVWRLSAGLIAERPLLGFGLGTFEDAFRLVRPADMALVYDKAHNVYIELVLELGIPASVCLLGTVAAAALLAGRAGARGDPSGAAALAGAALAAVHSAVDFPLQIPAVAATFAILLGLGAAAGVASRASSPARARATVCPPFDRRAARRAGV